MNIIVSWKAWALIVVLPSEMALAGFMNSHVSEQATVDWVLISIPVAILLSLWADWIGIGAAIGFSADLAEEPDLSDVEYESTFSRGQKNGCLDVGGMNFKPAPVEMFGGSYDAMTAGLILGANDRT